MPGWAILYLLTEVGFFGAGLLDDRARGRACILLAWGGAALLSDILLVTAFFSPGLAESLGRASLLLLVGSATFTTTSAALDIQALQARPREERKTLPIALLASALLYAPAFVLGGLVVLKAHAGAA